MDGGAGATSSAEATDDDDSAGSVNKRTNANIAVTNKFVFDFDKQQPAFVMIIDVYYIHYILKMFHY